MINRVAGECLQPRAAKGRQKAGQSLLEYSLLFAILLVGTVTFLRSVTRATPGRLEGTLQDVIACLSDYTKQCK